MHRFLVRAFALLILNVALVASVITYARANNDGGPLPRANFDNCDAAPCFAGITLNTPTAQVTANLTQRGIHFENELRIIVMSDWTVLDIALDGTRSYVTQISGFLQPYNATPPLPAFKLGNFVAEYGPPCKVQRRNNFIVLLYPKFMIIAKLANNRVSQESDTLQVRIGNEAFCADSSDTLRWAGFVPATRYDAMNPTLMP